MHTAGPEVQDIFDVLTDTGDTYESAEAKLTEYFKPQQNIPYNRHIFRQERQQEGELITQFVTRLRQLAISCDFGDKSDDFIRDQVFDKCASKHLRTKLLAGKDLKLTKILERAQAKEASEQHSAEMTEESAEKTFAIKSRPQQSKYGQDGPPAQSQAQQSKYGQVGPSAPQYKNYKYYRGRAATGGESCTRCGMTGHSGSECRRSKNIRCFRCHNLGHFQSACRSNLNETGGKMKHDQRQYQSKDSIRYVKSEDKSQYSSDDEFSADAEYAFSVTKHEGDSAALTVIIENEPVNMLIDSGSSCNIINTKTMNSFCERGCKFVKCHKMIHPYGSPPIICSNLVIGNVCVGSSPPVKANFLCVKGDQPSLLGRVTSEALGIIKLGVNHVSANSSSDILSQYPTLTQGIGCLKDVEVMLYIDKTVPPVARKHSRVPFHKRKKVADEIARLEKADIIERVTGPTEWVSRIVTPPKPKNLDEIRLCVDMREANAAIKRTRHVTPTIEELITDLSGAKVFSKIDLGSGYHQLMLKPECRYITTFSTHVGLYLYKRLNFGINSAA